MFLRINYEIRLAFHSFDSFLLLSSYIRGNLPQQYKRTCYVVPVLNEAPLDGDMWKNGDITPRILDIGQPSSWPSHIPQRVRLRLTLIVGRVGHRVGVCAVEVRSVGVHDTCALLGYYAEWSGNTLPTLRDNLSIPSWPFEMGPIDCPETSVTYYHYTLRNIEESRSRLLCGRSHKSGFSEPLSDITARWADNESRIKVTAPSDVAW
jgi:hypothetical protein